MEFIQSHIQSILETITTIVITIVVLKLIDIFVEDLRKKITAKDGCNSSIIGHLPILKKIFKAILIFFVFATILQSHGYSMTSLIAGFGITGLAVGFAAKESIANIFGSFAIMYDRIYNIGDYIIIGDIEGFVEDINLRSTKLRTLDNVLTILPNNIIANATIKNVSSINKRRLSEVIGITYDTSDEKIEEAMDILKNILKREELIEENYSVFVDKLDSSSINIKIVAYFNTPELKKFVEIKERFLTSAVREYRKANIEFAFPSQTIYLNKEN